MLQLFIIHFNLNIIFSFPFSLPTLRRKIGKLVQIVTEIIQQIQQPVYQIE